MGTPQHPNHPVDGEPVHPDQMALLDDTVPILGWTERARHTPPDLQAKAHARRSDPATSHAAAASVKNLRESQEAILALFNTNGPMTDTDLIDTYRSEQMFGPKVGREPLPAQSDSGIRTRRSELVALDKVYDTGQRALLSSGRRAIVWAAYP